MYRIHPAAVLVPGGSYFMVCNYIEGKPVAQKLNEMGISAFILYYRVGSKAHYPAPMYDLAHAVEEVLQQSEKYHIDPSNYSIWGSSAGGHLAASFGTENIGYIKYNLPKPKAIVLSYPVITMDKKYTHMMSHNNLLGEALEKAGVPSVMTIFPDAPHGAGPGTGTSAEGWIKKAVDFWLQNE